MALLVGALLAFAVGLLATAIGLDRDRAFYPTVMIVIILLCAVSRSWEHPRMHSCSSHWWAQASSQLQYLASGHRFGWSWLRWRPMAFLILRTAESYPIQAYQVGGQRSV